MADPDSDRDFDERDEEERERRRRDKHHIDPKYLEHHDPARILDNLREQQMRPHKFPT